MKTITTILATALAVSAITAEAQVIDKTTYWNFEQFATNNETVGKYNSPLNYGGLYIAGHSGDKPTVMKTLAANSEKRNFYFDNVRYNVNTYIQIPGNASTPNKDVKADGIKQDAIALDVNKAGVLYIQAEGSAAGRGIDIYFNAEKKTTATSPTKNEAFTATAENSDAGTYYIKSTAGACNIYAVKFIPKDEDSENLQITMPSQGIRTFSDNHAWKVPEGMEAYIAGKETGNGENIKLTLTKIENIPACTGVILRGEANGKYEMEPTDCGSLYNSDQTKPLIDVNYAFRPVICDYSLTESKLATTSSEYNNYLLANKGGVLVFGPAAAGELKSGKAYYHIRGDQDAFAKYATTSGAKGISLDFNNTTGINEIDLGLISSKDKRYNITGQQVGTDFKGITIQNGKKYIVK